MRARSTVLRCCLLLIAVVPCRTAQPAEDLAKQLAGVKLDYYAKAPLPAQAAIWHKGELFFASAGGLYRVDAERKVHKFLEINPAGFALRGDGHLLIADNKYKALLDLAPDGKVGVVAERFESETLRSLRDVTFDTRGNVYWSDPGGPSASSPTGSLYRLRPDGRVDRLATGLASLRGLAVDPADKSLFAIEGTELQRYDLPDDNALLAKPKTFRALGFGAGGCAFDTEGRLWVAESRDKATDQGSLLVLGSKGEALVRLNVPARFVNGVVFGGAEFDEIFCATAEPNGVFHAHVGVKGFAGHPGKPLPILRELNLVSLRPHADSEALRRIAQAAADAPLEAGHLDKATRLRLKELVAGLNDAQFRRDMDKLLPALEQAAAQHGRDRLLLAEIKRLGGAATIEIDAPNWLRSIAGDEGLPIFGRIVEIELNERTDGHKEPVPKKLSDRVTDDWLTHLAGQDRLRRLELSGTAITSAGLIHLKELKNLERLNICLTAVDDRGFEHLAGLTKMRRMVVCASKITGTGFKHLQGMKQLESINLHSSPASDAGLEAIGKLTSLRRLEIVHTHVTDAGLKHLAGLVHLEQLHVHGPETTAAALPFLGQLKELYQLDVYDRAASSQTLEQIGQLPKLRFLTLPIGIFDDAGVKHLAGLKTLEELGLDSPNVTDASIETLAGLHNLRKLQLGRAKLTAAGRQRLATLLPKTAIGP